MAVAHTFHLFMDLTHFGLAEARRLADSKCVDVHLRQRLHLDGKPKGLFERVGRYDQAMVAEKAGVAIFEGLEGVV